MEAGKQKVVHSLSQGDHTSNITASIFM